MLECHLSWQAQHVKEFGQMGGARNAVLLDTKFVSGVGGSSSSSSSSSSSRSSRSSRSRSSRSSR